MLIDKDNAGVHPECIQAILSLFNLPESGEYSPEELKKNKYVSDNAKQVSKLFADYLNITPRSDALPSFLAVNEILLVCEKYKHCALLFLPELWKALVDVHNDPSVPNHTKSIINNYFKDAANG